MSHDDLQRCKKAPKLGPGRLSAAIQPSSQESIATLCVCVGGGGDLGPVLMVTMAASTLELRPRVELIAPTRTVWGVRNGWVQHGGSACV